MLETAPTPPPSASRAAPSPTPASTPLPVAPPRLTLIGAGHVFRIEQTIQQAILAIRPDVVFVELDAGRLDALLERQRTGQAPQGKVGFVHRRLAGFQEEVAGLYGADVGGEMLAAVQAGQAIGAKVALVDASAQEALRRAIQQITLREKLRALGMFMAGGLRSLRPGRDAKAEVEEELRRYQEEPLKVMEELRHKFPTLHRILIAERDQAMTQRIRQGLVGARHGLAVLGDGHLNGMAPLLSDLHPTVYRLADVRAGRLPNSLVATGTPERLGFTVRYG